MYDKADAHELEEEKEKEEEEDEEEEEEGSKPKKMKPTRKKLQGGTLSGAGGYMYAASVKRSKKSSGSLR